MLKCGFLSYGTDVAIIMKYQSQCHHCVYGHLRPKTLILSHFFNFAAEQAYICCGVVGGITRNGKRSWELACTQNFALAPLGRQVI